MTAQEYEERVSALRQRLLTAQARLAQADFPVLLVFAGVDGAGKGDLTNLLSEWMDPRRIRTHAYARPTEDERERPEFWRFWRDLPPRGSMGIFLKAWYSKPLLQRAYGRTDDAELEAQSRRITRFEDTLTADRALILKYWMHLDEQQQESRLRSLAEDPLTSWRVHPRDWEHQRMYHAFVHAADLLMAGTSTPCPWRVIDGSDVRGRGLEVGTDIAVRLERALERTSPPGRPRAHPTRREAPTGPNVLDGLDLGKRLDAEPYLRRLQELRARLNSLHRAARSAGILTVLVFEGMDASGKGGAIRRLTPALDARDTRVVSIGPPTEDELAYHYLWRFWRLLPRAGQVVIFDRSWYGRVLVERIEGFASPEEWERAYDEINAFERHLFDSGAVLVKFWLHVSDAEQGRRFEARARVPYKRWKLTDEDWRNRRKRVAYEQAVHDMVVRTSPSHAPWTLVEADDKPYARIRVLEEVCARLEEGLERSRDRSDDVEEEDG